MQPIPAEASAEIQKFVVCTLRVLVTACLLRYIIIELSPLEFQKTPHLLYHSPLDNLLTLYLII